MTDDESSSSRWWRSKTHLAIFYLLHKKLIDRKRCRFSFDRPTEHNIKQHLKLWPTPVSAIIMNADFWGVCRCCSVIIPSCYCKPKGVSDSQTGSKEIKERTQDKGSRTYFKKKLMMNLNNSLSIARRWHGTSPIQLIFLSVWHKT